LAAAEQVKGVYKLCRYRHNSDIELIDGTSYSSNIKEFTKEQCREVVDYIVNDVDDENSDGTITLIVDGVWADYNSDLAFTNTILVQPFDDGTFRYLSNSIEQKELELPEVAGIKN